MADKGQEVLDLIKRLHSVIQLLNDKSNAQLRLIENLEKRVSLQEEMINRALKMIDLAFSVIAPKK